MQGQGPVSEAASGRYGGSARELDLETLLGLLEMYETALAELRATGDEKVFGLIHRFEQRRAEAAAIADKNSEEIAVLRPSAGE
jgi:hypothetical protein